MSKMKGAGGLSPLLDNAQKKNPFFWWLPWGLPASRRLTRKRQARRPSVSPHPGSSPGPCHLTGRLARVVVPEAPPTGAGTAATCLCTRLESLAWSQQGFWQPSFWWKRNLWSLCFDGGNIVVVLLIDFLEERKCVERLWRKKNRHIYTFPFLHASNAETPIYYSHHIKGFINNVFCRNLAFRNPAGTRLDSLAW